jgi:ParB family chromosome partitioning protein
MAKAVHKITLSASRDIPFNQLVLSQANVRRVKAGVSIEELADDIARRTLLQSLTVRAVLDADGAPTGLFEIPAGGRRYRALEVLVKRKQLARTAPIPCVVRTDGIAEEDSLAENVQRAPLHPLDQFRAFLTLRERGESEEEIAAAFFVSVGVVKQRLRLAAVSPKLLDVYADDAMTLDQLIAFCVTSDHERQEQVWEAMQRSHNKEPYQIRRLLTEGAVRASDKRAQYAGEDYSAAGGEILRDLFQSDDGGWLQDVGLLDRLVAEKLERDARTVGAEGWKWVEAATDFPYGHTYDLRRIIGAQPPLTEEETAALAAFKAEAQQLEATYADAEELPEHVDHRLGELETAIAAIEERPAVYDPDDMANAGVFVSLDGSGTLRVERGYVRPEDEPPLAEPGASIPRDEEEQMSTGTAPSVVPATSCSDPGEVAEDDEGLRPIPEKLLTELTAHRTLALRDAVGGNPAVACLAILHVLCLKLFYRYSQDSCLEIEPKSVVFGAQAPGLADTPLAMRVDARHRLWAAQLPAEPGELWDALTAFDMDSRETLFAHCVSLTINAVHEAWNRRPKAFAHADKLAQAVSLDMVAAGWTPTVDTFFGRVTKARILDAVREATSEEQAQLIDHLKKGEMAAQAEQLLAGSGWLPEPLRTPGSPIRNARVTPAEQGVDPSIEGSALCECETAIDPTEGEADTVDRSVAPHAIAAE